MAKAQQILLDHSKPTIKKLKILTLPCLYKLKTALFVSINHQNFQKEKEDTPIQA